MFRKVIFVIAVIMIIIIVAGVITMAILIDNFKVTNAVDFWYLTCRINLGSKYEDCLAGGKYAILQEKWIIFNRTEYHGMYVARVRTDEVLKTFPEVLTRLDLRAQNASSDDWITIGYKNWLKGAANPPGIEDVPTLINSIETALKEFRYQKTPQDIEKIAEWNALEEYDFDRRLRKSKWYWASAIFETVWLAGLVWFIAWPIIKSKRSVRIWIHMALLPIMLFLPFYLGYAPYTFTGSFPGGGILYPFALIEFRGGSMNQFDLALLSYVPQILEPLSPEIGSPMAITGLGAPGPTSVCLAGVLLALTYVIFTTFIIWAKPAFFKSQLPD